MGKNIKLKILDYTEYPEVRYIDQDEENSGEGYYYDFIKPNFDKALSIKVKLEVDLDDTAGYGYSFIDEAFGNLAYDFKYQEIIDNLIIISELEPDWEEEIFENILPIWKKKREEGKPRKE
ncbi:STAS-like domain-containing protein [Myroides odoratus]|uniref:STAS-like domain-containing protein n=1 Tax=Myroides odoratus TaxID=256 RepID=UPI00333F118A